MVSQHISLRLRRPNNNWSPQDAPLLVSRLLDWFTLIGDPTTLQAEDLLKQALINFIPIFVSLQMQQFLSKATFFHKTRQLLSG